MVLFINTGNVKMWMFQSSPISFQSFTRSKTLACVSTRSKYFSPHWLQLWQCLFGIELSSCIVLTKMLTPSLQTLPALRTFYMPLQLKSLYGFSLKRSLLLTQDSLSSPLPPTKMLPRPSSDPMLIFISVHITQCSWLNGSWLNAKFDSALATSIAKFQ